MEKRLLQKSATWFDSKILGRAPDSLERQQIFVTATSLIRAAPSKGAESGSSPEWQVTQFISLYRGHLTGIGSHRIEMTERESCFDIRERPTSKWLDQLLGNRFLQPITFRVDWLYYFVGY